jgi:aryl-alcohol dehydrogenase-like predicted oxidoreductase
MKHGEGKTMETRRIGNLDVSLVGLGCNNFGMRIDEAQTKTVVDAALDEGINLFDTADVYGGRGRSEEFLGKALGSRRDEALIATKFGSPMSDDGQSQGGSKRWVVQAVEDSLRRLGTDRIDLYQLHSPDADTPQDETLEALDAAVRAGKVREIGCSNFGSTLIDEARTISAEKGLAPYASVQNNYSLLERGVEKKVLPACERHGMGVLPYFPLASGLLTGKYTSPDDLPEGTRLAMMAQAAPDRAKQVLSEENFARVGKLRAYAEEHGHTLLDLAMSWLASRPVISSVISGATKPEQVRANVQAASWRLTPEEMAQVDEIAK